MKEYVLGFMFSKDKSHIALICKEKPEWQKGKINGIGGKVEPEDRRPIYSMIREFKEETGVETNITHWGPSFATMNFEDSNEGGIKSVIYCYRAFTDLVYDVKTMELEEIKLLSTIPVGSNDSHLPYFDLPIINNLKVLIPMAMDEDFIHAELKIYC